jgi:hypothetical protein
VHSDYTTLAKGGLHARQHKTIGAGTKIDLVAVGLFFGVCRLAGLGA